MHPVIQRIVRARLLLAIASAGLLVALAAGPTLPVGGYLAVLAGAAVFVGLWVAGVIFFTIRARRRRDRHAEPR